MWDDSQEFAEDVNNRTFETTAESHTAALPIKKNFTVSFIKYKQNVLYKTTFLY